MCALLNATECLIAQAWRTLITGIKMVTETGENDHISWWKRTNLVYLI